MKEDVEVQTLWSKEPRNLTRDGKPEMYSVQVRQDRQD